MYHSAVVYVDASEREDWGESAYGREEDYCGGLYHGGLLSGYCGLLWGLPEHWYARKGMKKS